MNSNERMIVIIVAGSLVIGSFWFLSKKAFAAWRSVRNSTLVCTTALLFFYYFFVEDSSHGIVIVLLPLVITWIIWRRETTGKPQISPGILLLFQVTFSILFPLLIWWQEH
ncbi:MAG: hypothetical protein ABH878_04355 [bacterium]